MAATNLTHAPPARPSPAQASQPAQEQAHQEHPIGLYLKVWALLFILSALSYMVDYLHFQGLLRWTLIVTLMLLKAGLIIAVFMHMAWERVALVTAILVPPIALLVLVGMMASEAGYTFLTRILFFR